MDECDQPGCNNKVTHFVAVQRPSDKSEIVAVMAFCKTHVDGEPQTLDQLRANWFDYCTATREVLYEYIETAEAAHRGHLFMSI